MTEEFSWQKWRSKWAQARHFQCELLPRVYICKKKPSHFWHYFWYSLAKKNGRFPRCEACFFKKNLGGEVKLRFQLVFEYVFLYIKNTWFHIIFTAGKKTVWSTSDFFCRRPPVRPLFCFRKRHALPIVQNRCEPGRLTSPEPIQVGLTMLMGGRNPKANHLGCHKSL